MGGTKAETVSCIVVHFQCEGEGKDHSHFLHDVDSPMTVIVALHTLYISTPAELISACASPMLGEANVTDDAVDSHCHHRGSVELDDEAILGSTIKMVNRRV